MLLDCAKQKIASIEKEEEALRPKIAEGDFVGKVSVILNLWGTSVCVCVCVCVCVRTTCVCVHMCRPH